MPKPFRAADPCQSHKPEQKKDVHGRVKSTWQRKMPIKSAQKTVLTEHGKPDKQAPHGDILAGFKSRAGAFYQSERCRHAFVGSRAGRPHSLGGLRVLPAALRLRGGFGGRRLANRLRLFDEAGATHRFAQSGILHSHLACHLRDPAPGSNEPRTFLRFFLTEYRAAAWGSGHIERGRPLLRQLPRPVHERTVRNRKA